MKVDQFSNLVSQATKNIEGKFDSKRNNYLVSKISGVAMHLSREEVDQLFSSERLEILYWVAASFLEDDVQKNRAVETLKLVANSSSRQYSDRATMVLAVLNSRK